MPRDSRRLIPSDGWKRPDDKQVMLSVKSRELVGRDAYREAAWPA